MNTALSQLLGSIEERSFNATETFRVLRTKPTWLWSWAARNYTQVPSKVYKEETGVFFFRVSGFLHKGYVVITLAYNDTYTVRLVSMKGEVKQTLTEVYVDELCEKIDVAVERQKEYVR